MQQYFIPHTAQTRILEETSFRVSHWQDYKDPHPNLCLTIATGNANTTLFTTSTDLFTLAEWLKAAALTATEAEKNTQAEPA